MDEMSDPAYLGKLRKINRQDHWLPDAVGDLRILPYPILSEICKRIS